LRLRAYHLPPSSTPGRLCQRWAPERRIKSSIRSAGPRWVFSRFMVDMVVMVHLAQKKEKPGPSETATNVVRHGRYAWSRTKLYQMRVGRARTGPERKNFEKKESRPSGEASNDPLLCR
jgi:hypothetical protein